MNRDPEQAHDELTSLLAAMDDALAAGAPVAEPAVSPDMETRLRRGLACLQLLHELRGRDSEPPGDAASVGEADQSVLPDRIGRFEIRRELGRGGFGVVFLALDPKLGREVALKVPHAQSLVTPELRRRFQYEARAAAALDHPNLVPVFECGEIGPICYIASAYCPGVTLASWLKTREDPVPAQEAAAICVPLAEALQHAHDRGVLHRDLKPSNVLLDPSSSSSSGGLGFVPRITDFGLARSIGPQADASRPPSGPLTLPGMIVGTPSYMSPEQAGSRPGDVGPATDVYGLGVLLYELLTGSPPFVSESALDTLQRVCHDEPVPPRRVRPRLPRDLETICLKCLMKDPRRRYGSARDVADDLRRYQDGRPIVARPVGRLELAWRWARREPKVAGLLLLLVLAVATGFAAVLSQWRQTRAERDTANREWGRAEANFRKARSVVERFAHVAEELRHQPRLDKTRRVLLAEVSSFYEDLLAQKSTDRDVRLEAARVCERLAEVRNWLGLWDDEAQAIQRGFELIEGLLSEAPRDPRYRQTHQALLVREARHQMRLDHGNECLAAYQKALAVGESLATDYPSNRAYRMDVANCLMNVGLQRSSTHPDAARRDFQGAVEVQRELLALEPANRWFRRELGLGLDELSRHRWNTGERVEAERLAREALAIRQSLVEDEPAMSWNREFLVRSQSSLAAMLQSDRRTDEAEAMLRQGIATIDALVADFPDAFDFLQRQARTWSELGVLLRSAGRHAEAEPVLRRAIDGLERLLRDFPAWGSNVRPRLATCRYELVLVLVRRGARTAASPILEQALEEAPGDPAIQNQMAWMLATDPDPAARDPKRAVELARKAVESRPRAWNFWNTLGVACYRAGALDQARDALERSMTLSGGGGPIDWLFMAMICRASDQVEPARSWYDRGARAVDQKQPPDLELLRFKAEAEQALAAARECPESEVR